VLRVAISLGCGAAGLVIFATGCQGREREAPDRAAPVPELVTSSRRPAPSSPAPTAPEGAIGPEGEGYQYAYPVRFFELESQRQKLRMAYIDAVPERPNGLTVLLLHGKNFSADYWAPTVEALTQAGFRVVAPDQIGFGKSSKPEGYQYSFRTLAGNTRALLQSIDVETTAVVGHSMGGMLAVRYALTFPEQTAKLALVNPIGLEDYSAYLPYRSVDDWYRQELALTPEKIRAYQQKAYYGGDWKPEYDRLLRLQAGMTRHPGYERVAWASALTYDMIVTQPVVNDLGRLRVGTLLVVGLADRTAVGRDLVPEHVAAELGNYPKLAERARAAIPKAKLVTLSGVGHVPQVQAFDRYSQALLEFLGGPPPRKTNATIDPGMR
jgi:pimeloyl-ACP methyl ester carboxylesterase